MATDPRAALAASPDQMLAHGDAAAWDACDDPWLLVATAAEARVLPERVTFAAAEVLRAACGAAVASRARRATLARALDATQQWCVDPERPHDAVRRTYAAVHRAVRRVGKRTRAERRVLGAVWRLIPCSTDGAPWPAPRGHAARLCRYEEARDAVADAVIAIGLLPETDLGRGDALVGRLAAVVRECLPWDEVAAAHASPLTPEQAGPA